MIYNNLNNILMECGFYGAIISDVEFRKSKITISGEVILSKHYKTLFNIDISTDDYRILGVQEQPQRRFK